MGKYPTEPLKGATPDDLDWFVGSWRAPMGAGEAEEHWSEPRGGVMMAPFRWIENGKAKFVELQVIEPDGDTVRYRIRHFDPGLVPWESEVTGPPFEAYLTYLGDGEAAFFLAKVTPPRWVVYRRDGLNQLTVFFTDDGETPADPGVFNYARDPLAHGRVV
jgi:hypothetical protein